MPCRSSVDAKSEIREQPSKVTKTTKLGMEIESDDDDDDGALVVKEESKTVPNGSFSSGFLKSKNLFNLRLSTDFGSKLSFDNTSPLPRKSPVTPYSRQTSSSDSQKSALSANSLQPPSEWENGNVNGGIHRIRKNSNSSSYSVSEGTTVTDNFTMNRSEYSCLIIHEQLSPSFVCLFA